MSSFQLRQTQRLAQEMRMTPQMQQAIKLLQLNRMELAEWLQTELVENPVFELDQQYTADFPAVGTDTPAVKEASEKAEDSVSVDSQSAAEDIDWAKYQENTSPASPGAGQRAESNDYDPTQRLTEAPGLVDHLRIQLRSLGLTNEEFALCELIIGNLDHRGYLVDTDTAELAELNELSTDEVDQALRTVQTLDPVGVGARDLRECLLLQVERKHPDYTLLREIITNHLGELERNRHSAIAKKLKAHVEDVKQAHRDLRCLDPSPGLEYDSEPPPYIIPDISIVKREGVWLALLNDDGLPRLRLSAEYKDTAKTGSDSSTNSFLKEKLRSAQWIIKSVEQRNSTILKVTQAIIEHQMDFFEKGVAHLRPLVLREIADEIGMHESTVSRVTSNKYVDTPRGTFELKYFFNSSIKTTDGSEGIAGESVRHAIQALVKEEDPAKPLSDQRLVEVLKSDHGIDIARRTVAKYRESMGIPSSSRRKNRLL